MTAYVVDANRAATFIDLGTLPTPAAGQGQGWHIVLSLGHGIELRLSQG